MVPKERWSPVASWKPNAVQYPAQRLVSAAYSGGPSSGPPSLRTGDACRTTRAAARPPVLRIGFRIAHPVLFPRYSGSFQRARRSERPASSESPQHRGPDSGCRGTGSGNRTSCTRGREWSRGRLLFAGGVLSGSVCRPGEVGWSEGLPSSPSLRWWAALDLLKGRRTNDGRWWRRGRPCGLAFDNPAGEVFIGRRPVVRDAEQVLGGDGYGAEVFERAVKRVRMAASMVRLMRSGLAPMSR
jgi:hypothetical protein